MSNAYNAPAKNFLVLSDNPTYREWEINDESQLLYSRQSDRPPKPEAEFYWVEFSFKDQA
ncbi:hypothetical protein INT80_06720 [Gallibacterium anatis]|uniref:Uncharacterized protein n=1 Tax=Gallibacterium anatis TaxID=750 RepID=A0A930Y528_9PAST|nr:hypothetical protein [Gallibacterium anatis]